MHCNPTKEERAFATYTICGMLIKNFTELEELSKADELYFNFERTATKLHELREKAREVLNRSRYSRTYHQRMDAEKTQVEKLP